MNEMQLIINIIFTLAILVLSYAVAVFYRTNNHLIAMAKNYAREMGKKSGEVRGETRRQRIREEHKGALLDAIGGEIPMASNVIGRMRQGGMKDNEILTLLSDPDIINGIVKLAEGTGTAIGAIKGLLGGERKPAGKDGGVPLIEMKG